MATTIYEGDRVRVNSAPFNNVFGEDTMNKIQFKVIAVQTQVNKKPTVYTVSSPDFHKGQPFNFLASELIKL